MAALPLVIDPIDPNSEAGLQYTNVDSCRAKLGALGARSVPICNTIAGINVLTGEIKAMIERLTGLIQQKEREKQDALDQVKALAEGGSLTATELKEANEKIQQKDREINELQTQINTFNDLIQNTLGMSRYTMEDFKRLLNGLLQGGGQAVGGGAGGGGYTPPPLPANIKEWLNSLSSAQAQADWFNADSARKAYIVPYMATLSLPMLLQLMQALSPANVTHGNQWIPMPVNTTGTVTGDERVALGAALDEANNRLTELDSAARGNPGFANIPVVADYWRTLQEFVRAAQGRLG